MNIPIGENEVRLCGVIQSEPEISHASRGREFLRFILEVRRLSGNTDSLNIIIPKDRLPENGIHLGDPFYVLGQLRSFNSKNEDGRRLIISIYALEIERLHEEAHANDVVLKGVICKQPVLRKTPLGREICDVMLAVNRHYGRADYLPVILWGQTARCLSELEIGDEIRVQGRIQSRVYIKTINEQQFERVAFEVSAVEAEAVTEDSTLEG